MLATPKWGTKQGRMGSGPGENFSPCYTAPRSSIDNAAYGKYGRYWQKEDRRGLPAAARGDLRDPFGVAIESVYETALDPSRWPDALETIAYYLGGVGAISSGGETMARSVPLRHQY
jgi:hypothetical protein